MGRVGHVKDERKGDVKEDEERCEGVINRALDSLSMTVRKLILKFRLRFSELFVYLKKLSISI